MKTKGTLEHKTLPCVKLRSLKESEELNHKFDYHTTAERVVVIVLAVTCIKKDGERRTYLTKEGFSKSMVSNHKRTHSEK